MNKIAYNYKDILLQPSYSLLESRQDATTECQFGPMTFNLPVVPANMKTVIDKDLAVWMAERNYFYVMHRFNVNTVEFCRDMKERGLFTSISLGVNDDSYTTILDLVSKGISPDYITIDIAHGHCKKMMVMLSVIKNKLPKSFVIAGNVCTINGVAALESWGADSLKVGIGPGCFIAGSKVITKNGIKTIEDIQKGDEVLTHKGRYQNVVDTISRLEEDKLVTINDSITSTAQHEFYVIEKKNKNIVTDDNLHNYAFFIEAENLTNDHLLIQYK